MRRGNRNHNTVGSAPEEFDALGIPFRQRVARTEESMQALRSLWRDEVASFNGEQFSWQDVGSFPKPVQPNALYAMIESITPRTHVES